tara:strand:- start:101 stop:397 length:297 start_codon:yes stop_codon:yes gene_type:complete
MKNSIRTELLEHINESLSDGLKTHDEMFNEDYYIIGYYQSSQWLEEHGLGELEAVNICKDFEREIYGDVWTEFDNTEQLVNNLVFWYGLELCNELNID